MSGEEYPCDFAKSGMGIRNYYSPTGTFLGPEDPGGGYSQYSDDRDDLRIFYGL